MPGCGCRESVDYRRSSHRRRRPSSEAVVRVHHGVLPSRPVWPVTFIASMARIRGNCVSFKSVNSSMSEHTSDPMQSGLSRAGAGAKLKRITTVEGDHCLTPRELSHTAVSVGGIQPLILRRCAYGAACHARPALRRQGFRRPATANL